MMAVGMGLDLATLARKKVELQQATDAAALAIAREGQKVTDAQAHDIARRFLTGSLKMAYTNLRVTHSNTQYTVQADVDGGTYFSNLFGYTEWQVTAASTADLALVSYEIALVLDTTGSMAGGKLTSMKDAVVSLIDTMSTQVDDDDRLKFALVPFASFVNVGPGFAPAVDSEGRQVDKTGAAWLDLKGEAKIPQVELGNGASRFQLYANLGQTWRGCVETRYAAGKDYDISDEPADPKQPETLFVPAFAIDEPDMGYDNSYIISDAKPNNGEAAQKKKRWKKYGVGSDAAGNPKDGGLPEPVLGGRGIIAIDTSLSNFTKLSKGPGLGCEMQPIAPLGNDYDALKTKVDALRASGGTNIPEGVAWGNRVLSPGAPFTEGKDEAKETGIEKIMIVLTDGTNDFGNSGTKLGSFYSSYGYLVDNRLGTTGGKSATTEKMNAKTLAACDIAKEAGVEIYAIRLEEPNVTTGDMLKKCASDASHYFDVPTRGQLDEAFKEIREKITKVRLAS